MNTREVRIGNVTVGGGNPLTLIAGPCMLESKDMAMEVGVGGPAGLQ